MGNIMNFIHAIWHRERPKKAERTEYILQAFQAAKKGDVQALQDLMDRGSCSSEPPLSSIVDSETSCTLLHVAMERGNRDCIQFLITSGCSLTQGNRSQETPLHVACMNDNLVGLTVALEIERELDLDTVDMWQRTLLLKAMVYKSQRVVQMLLNHNVNLNAQDIYGLSMIHLAARYGQLDLFRILVAKGANLNLQTEKFRTPLSSAVIAHNADMVKELLIHGANTNNCRSTQPVITALSELIRCFEDGVICDRAEQVLHIMLAAHGLPLHSDEPEVFLRVLFTTDEKRFLPLLHKMHACSDCPYIKLLIKSSSIHQQSSWRSGPQKCTPVSLFDLARRSARSALMKSGRNVVWAVERLGSSMPPAVKGLLLLKDCDHKEFSL